MLSVIRPDFEVVKAGRILHYVMVGGSYHHSLTGFSSVGGLRFLKRHLFS
jgi:hypothetical protein